MVAFTPPTDFRPESGRDKFTRCCAACGVGGVGVEEMRHQLQRAFGVSSSVSSAMMRACCQDMAPVDNASNTGGREQTRRDWSTNAPAAAELMVRTPAISSTVDISA